jgi:signal transduction histidine kinase
MTLAEHDEQDDVEAFKTAFLSLISHELRAPIQTINGYLDLTLAGLGGELNTQQAQFLRRARASSERMGALVDDLILLARYAAGKLSWVKSDLDPAPLIHDVIEELRPLAEEAGVQVRTRLPAPLPLLAADGPRIEQAVRDLLLNALAATPAGEVVSVSARVIPDMSGVVGMLVLTVRDRGIRIASEGQKKVLEQFFRDGAPAGIERPHTFGLACVHIIAEGHGAQMRIQSAPRKGTAVSIWLPVLSDNA